MSDIDQWGNIDDSSYYKNDSYNKYATYQAYREKQRAGYFSDEEVVSLEEYEYQISLREEQIKDLKKELTQSRNLKAELDKIRSILFLAGVIHDRDGSVVLSDKISWVLDRQKYRINEIGLHLQIDD